MAHLYLPLVIAAGVLFAISAFLLIDKYNCLERYEIGGERWVIARKTFRYALVGLVASFVLLVGAFASKATDAPAPPPEQVYPDFERTFYECIDRLGNSKAKQCTEMASKSVDGEPLTVYTKIPYREFMDVCIDGYGRKVTGDVALPLYYKHLEYCSNLGATKMKGLISE